jgi:hypothetical protein
LKFQKLLNLKVNVLPVFIELTEVQVDPLKDSVTADKTFPAIKPPKANAAVCIPAPANYVLACINRKVLSKKFHSKIL